MKKNLSTKEYLDRLSKLMESGDIEEIKRFRQEYVDYKIDICREDVKPSMKINGAHSLDDEPF